MREFRLFFVFGVPKSGTTWLQLRLDAHPEIGCVGESALPHFVKTLRRETAAYNAAPTQQMLHNSARTRPPIEPAEMAVLIRGFLLGRLRRAAASGKAIVGHKDPQFLLDGIEPLAAAFPRAGYVHIVRDPRDCWVSAQKHRDWQPAAFARWDGSITASARRWSGSVRALHAVRSRRSLRYHELRYEDPNAAPEATLAALLAFLAARADPATVRACLAAADFAKLSGGRARGEEDPRSFFRKGVVGDWRNHLSRDSRRRSSSRPAG